MVASQWLVSPRKMLTTWPTLFMKLPSKFFKRKQLFCANISFYAKVGLHFHSQLLSHSRKAARSGPSTAAFVKLGTLFIEITDKNKKICDLCFNLTASLEIQSKMVDYVIIT